MSPPLDYKELLKKTIRSLGEDTREEEAGYSPEEKAEMDRLTRETLAEDFGKEARSLMLPLWRMIQARDPKHTEEEYDDWWKAKHLLRNLSHFGFIGDYDE